MKMIRRQIFVKVPAIRCRWRLPAGLTAFGSQAGLHRLILRATNL